MSRRVVIGKGKAKVVLTGALAGELEDELLASLGPLGTRIKAQAQQLRDDAFSRWPVLTGKSRAGLATQLKVDPSRMRIEASVTNTQRYARYIGWASRELRLYESTIRQRPPNPQRWVEARRFTNEKNGLPMVVFKPAHPAPANSTAPSFRGSVMYDLLVVPSREARERLKTDLPALVAELLRRAGGG